MNRRLGAAIALLIVAAGAVWWFGLRGGGGKTREPAAAATPPSGARAARARPRPDGDRGPQAGELAVLVDDDPVGALRLEGLVLGADDQPVEGATVMVTANPPRQTTTDSDGSFAFEHLVGRPYTLVARAPGGVGGPVTAKLTATSEPVVLRLRPAGSVAVTVLDPTRAPVAGAAVQLRGLDDQDATSDGAGVARFAVVAPDRYEVVARAPGFAATFQGVVVAAAPVEVTVVLTAGAPVSGRVVDGSGAGVAGARVSYGGASDWSIQADPRRDGVVSDGDGRFRFDALPAGSFRFEARHPEFAPGESAIVTLDGVTARDGVEIAVDAGATVSGRVVDAGKQPVAGARVRIGAVGRGMLGQRPRQVYSADDGAWQVKGLPRKPMSAVAIGERGASDAIDVDTSAGDVTGVVLTLDQTGTIAGIVVDRTGEPLEGVQVAALPDFRSGNFDPAAMRLRGMARELTDAGGRFELVGLAPGSYRVRADRSPSGRRRWFAGRGRGEGEVAETGTRDLRIVLPADGGVKGKVAFADGTVPTPFTVSVGMTQEPVASKDGSFTLADLAPREYQLTVRGPQFDEKRVTVTVEEGEVADAGTITVKRGRRIAGRVVIDGRPVAGATVIAGLQIFGNGSSNEARFGGGPPGRGNNRETTTDEDGNFELTGLGTGALAVVAEHADFGRSPARRVVPGAPDELTLELSVAGFGILTGTVRDADGPAEDTIVTVQSVTTPNAMYSVATGPDGSYRLDRLAPDTYKVSAMLGMPMRGGMRFTSKQAAVTTGTTTRVDLTVEQGGVAVIVDVSATEGEVRGGVTWLFAGRIAARTVEDVSLRSAAMTGSSGFTFFFPGRPASHADVVPGSYTACAAAAPLDMPPMEGSDYFARHAADLPVSCKGFTVTPTPGEQTVKIEVTVPPYVAE